MPVLLERKMRFPPDVRSSVLARRMLRAALEESGLEELVDSVVLLTSELCDNAVLHAGTEYELELTVSSTEVTVAVTDQGPGPLELHLALPRTGRAATHGRGLLLVQRLAAAWGTRHDASGHHRTWFVIHPADPPQPPPAAPLAGTGEGPGDGWPAAQTLRWLIHVPTSLAGRLELSVLTAELLRRLCDVAGAEWADVTVDYGDGRPLQQLARYGPSAEPPAEQAGVQVIETPLPLPSPLRGTVRLALRTGAGENEGEHGDGKATTADRAGDAVPGAEQSSVTPVLELAELSAQRIALSVESEWLHDADQRRRSWMTYLADTSELLAQSLNVELTVAMVPQLVVPRLGRWCAVHLVDEQVGLRLTALTHADEERIPALRTHLDAPGPDHLRAQLAAVLRRGAGPTGIGVPGAGVAVALTARGQPFGVLTVGRAADRPHSPEEIMLISDLARRASLAIENAQITAAHITTSQALQQALLPRELPEANGVEFAAEYLPASTVSDVGGDFYDALTLDRDRWLISIGDVCGKGSRAAARTGLVREVLRVLVRDERSLPHAIELLNGVMLDANNPEQFCTVAVALVSRAPDWLDVELVLAGHERPVVLRADGSVELIGEHGTAVGLLPEVSPACTQHRLHPGDALVTYTDGVTERRRGPDMFGQDRLLDAVAGAAGGSATDLVAAVRTAIEAFSADPRRDDIAVLVVRALPS